VLSSAEADNFEKESIFGLPSELMKGIGFKIRKMFRVFIP
jgi:hypothetical protein